MDEQNELNNIILNQRQESGGNKKLLLAIATLAIILIIVVAIMSRINSNSAQGIPQAILPPEPDEPLFEPVSVIEEPSQRTVDLAQVARKIKDETLNKGQEMEEDVNTYAPMYEEMDEEEAVVVEPVIPTPVVSKSVSRPKPKQLDRQPSSSTHAAVKGKYYLQVGSFAKFSPSKRFIQTITGSGYDYTYHQVIRGGKTINKVLIGPFNTQAEARRALPIVRKKIEAGAFLTKV